MNRLAAVLCLLALVGTAATAGANRNSADALRSTMPWS